MLGCGPPLNFLAPARASAARRSVTGVFVGEKRAGQPMGATDAAPILGGKPTAPVRCPLAELGYFGLLIPEA